MGSTPGVEDEVVLGADMEHWPAGRFKDVLREAVTEWHDATPGILGNGFHVRLLVPLLGEDMEGGCAPVHVHGVPNKLLGADVGNLGEIKS